MRGRSRRRSGSDRRPGPLQSDRAESAVERREIHALPAGPSPTASHAHSRPDGLIDCSFEVTDTGIGMSEEFQKSMFEPFTQEFDNPERKKLSSGTGLGLSIVKRLVDLMGRADPGKKRTRQGDADCRQLRSAGGRAGKNGSRRAKSRQAGSSEARGQGAARRGQ
jgi:hypothetical protein